MKMPAYQLLPRLTYCVLLDWGDGTASFHGADWSWRQVAEAERAYHKDRLRREFNQIWR